MELIAPVLFGIILIFIGLRMYNYFHKNRETINNEPGKLYGIAVTVVISGLSLMIVAFISYFNEK